MRPEPHEFVTGPRARGAGRIDGLLEHLRADALKPVAKTLQSTLAVKGELPADDLAAR